ncbi:MAG: glycosyltransferase [Prevotella sp.]|nr:glycosyltransferase [Prevotella sp.]MBO7128484.1 glycosyltransferase [Prevotella sp.]
MNKKLSIIIPVYNVEKYIRSCIESVYRQGLNEDDYEVIIINDGTKDRSMEMIADIIQMHSNITIINQENQGLSVVRNNGIAVAKGEYILMPDSDDLLIENSLNPLLEKALESQADLVVADYLSMTDEEIEQTNTSLLQKTKLEYKEKTGEELFLQNLNPYHCFVWRTLYRREFLIDKKLTFVPGIYIQDVPFTHECYLKAQKCIRTSWLLNIYRKGHESATYSFNIKKAKDFCTAIAKTWELTRLEYLSPQIQEKLREDVYTSFSMIIWITVHKIKKQSERIEIIDFLKYQAPDLWFRNGTKQKLESYMYHYLPHWFIHLRYFYATICRK